MQAGTHLGKILVRMPSSVDSLPPPVVKRFPKFRSDAAYLLIGGLGGVGRSVSTWMVEQNARELIFLSRSAGKSEEDIAFIQELEAQGCQVICVPGNVTDLKAVKEAVASCTRPLAGVLQMAIDLRVRLFSPFLAPMPCLTYHLGSALPADEPRGVGGCVGSEGLWNLESASCHIAVLT